MIEREKKEKTLGQAFKELIRGYDVIGNLKFIVISLFGILEGKK